MSRALLVVALAAGLWACGGEGRPDEELGPLVISPRAEEPAPIDLDEAATSTAELARALALGPDALGAHRATGSSRIELREGDAIQMELEDQTRLFVAEDGSFSATLDNSEDYGRHVYFVDGDLYLRPRYGKYHRRAPNDEAEPGRILGEIGGTVAAYFELLAPGAELAKKGTREVAGRPGVVIGIQTAAEPGQAPAQRLSQRGWREDAQVEAATGEIVLDADTGALLRAELEGAVSFEKDGRRYQMRLEARHEVADVGTDDRVSPPPASEVMAIPLRPSELAERERLLEDIAPPARRAPTPTNPDGISAPAAGDEGP